jgi:hypothetical protein
MTGFMSAAVRTHNSVRNDSNGLPVLQRTGEDNAPAHYYLQQQRHKVSRIDLGLKFRPNHLVEECQGFI